MRAAWLVLALMLAAAGCGSGEASPSATPSGPAATPTSSPSPNGTDLTVSVVDEEGQTRRWRLTCAPAGGDHPDPAGACAALAEKAAEALPAVASDQMCTEVYGGPQTATLTGTWQGKPVNSSFSRTNGCEIARWDALVPLLPKPPR
jgi:hypothetical protein